MENEILKKIEDIEKLVDTRLYDLVQRVSKLEASKSDLKWFIGIILSLGAIILAILK